MTSYFKRLTGYQVHEDGIQSRPTQISGNGFFYPVFDSKWVDDHWRNWWHDQTVTAEEARQEYNDWLYVRNPLRKLCPDARAAMYANPWWQRLQEELSNSTAGGILFYALYHAAAFRLHDDLIYHEYLSDLRPLLSDEEFRGIKAENKFGRYEKYMHRDEVLPSAPALSSSSMSDSLVLKAIDELMSLGKKVEHLNLSGHSVSAPRLAWYSDLIPTITSIDLSDGILPAWKIFNMLAVSEVFPQLDMLILFKSIEPQWKTKETLAALRKARPCLKVRFS